MHEGNRYRAFPHGRRHTLDTVRPHITDREHARSTGFKEVGRPAERPMPGSQFIRGQRWAGFNKALWVECDAAIEPVCAGIGARS